jgi:hypothetical protein
MQAPAGAFLQGSKIISNLFNFNDTISPVVSGISNTAVCQTKPQGSSRNIFQKVCENSKIQVQKVTPKEIIINTPKKGRNMLQITRKERFLPSTKGPKFIR